MLSFGPHLRCSQTFPAGAAAGAAAAGAASAETVVAKETRATIFIMMIEGVVIEVSEKKL